MLKKKKIMLFLGNVRAGEYEKFIENNINIGLILDKNNSKKISDLAAFEFVESYDFKKDMNGLFKIIDSLNSRYHIQCLLNMREFYVRHAAILCEKYGFKGLSLISAENCLSKSKMRDLFLAKIGEHASAKYCMVTCLQDIRNFVDKIGVPVILKPSNLHSSIFVYLIETKNDVEAIYSKMKKGILNYYQKSIMHADKILLQAEEYLQGSTHSIDCLIDAKGLVHFTPIVDVITAKDLGINDFHHYSRKTPSALGYSQQAQVHELAIRAVKALGIQNALAHVEFIFTKNGPRLLEVGARPGGNRAQMLNKAYGIDLILAHANALQGKKFDLEKKWEKSFAFVTPFPTSEGIFKNFNCLERITKLPSYYDHRAVAEAGSRLGLAKNGYMNVITIELCSDKVDTILCDIDYISKLNDLFNLEC